MSLRVLLLSAILLAASCGQNTSHQNHEAASQPVEENPNQGLYDQVMAIHDEVMPQMDDLYKMKTAISEKLKDTANLTAGKKEALENLSLQLDQASKSMMDWMHQFKPDNIADAEQNRAYLEDEMEKIKNVQNEVLEILEKAREEIDKN